MDDNWEYRLLEMTLDSAKQPSSAPQITRAFAAKELHINDLAAQGWEVVCQVTGTYWISGYANDEVRDSRLPMPTEQHHALLFKRRRTNNGDAE